jgi:hypothetical protein
MSASFQKPKLVVLGLFGVLIVLAGAAEARAQGAGSTGGFGGSTAGFGGGGAGIGGGSFGGSSFGGTSFGGGSTSSSFSGMSGSSGTGAFGVSQSSFAPTQATATAFGGGGGFGARGSSGSMGGITAGVQPSNILGPYYTNPYAGGLSTNTRAIFGTPLYNTITSTTTTMTNVSRPGGIGTGSLSGVATTIHRGPSFAFVLAPEMAPLAQPASRLQRDLEQVIANSSALSSNRAIRIDIVQSTVVLRGMVSNDRDRRLAESLIRLSPGVRDVRNELKTLEALPPPPPQPNQPPGPN